MISLWPHQQKALDGIQDAMSREVRRILTTAPTGGGKTRIMLELVKWGFPVSFYLNSKMLVEQFAGILEAEGISFGYRWSEQKPRLLENVQLSSIQTDYERCIKQKRWQVHNARIAFVDEAHDQKGEMAEAIIDTHYQRGDYVVGFTATPLDLGYLYDELIVAGTNSELRACGALLPSTTYAPNEPAAPKLKPTVDGRYTEAAVKHALDKVIGYADIYQNWKRFNPEARPAIGFAHSVEASLGHAMEFYERGVPCAHIDGDDTWINGEWYYTDAAARAQLTEASRTGEVKIVWNRFVLREGIDWPWIYHGIFATIFGSLTAYLQAGGRVLRNHESLPGHVIFQDHGGNWWRHGSLNSDRVWELGDTQKLVTSLRAKRLREKKEPEPIVCPKCHAVRQWGRECSACGHVSRRRPRYIIQHDGTLKEMEGDIFKPRRISKKPSDIKRWERVFYRAKNKKMTFEQAFSLFAKEGNWAWPDPAWPLMPISDLDCFRLVKDVPYSRLTGGSKYASEDESRQAVAFDV